MPTLERALEIAREAHAGQVDKGGQPVFNHVLRVVAAVQTPAERIAAALHDVIEDCGGWDLNRLAAEGFSLPVLIAIGDLTRRQGQDYFDYIRQAAERAIPSAVKIADLRDHLAPERVGNLTPSHRRRYERALAALERITSATPEINRARDEGIRAR